MSPALSVSASCRISQWLLEHGHINAPLPPVPCQGDVIPDHPRINPNEATDVIRLWLRYCALYQQAAQQLPTCQFDSLTNSLSALPNLYMANWMQTAHAIELIQAVL